MIKHVVVLRFLPDADQRAIDRYTRALAQLPEQIPGILDFQYGADIGKAQGPQFAHNWDFTVSATFESLADYAVYSNHPAHLALVADYLGGLMQDRAGVQYELRPPA
jgi:Stress responsive A/B Barrel Domain